MPITLAKPGEAKCIKRIGGKDETKRFLGNLGIVVGSEIQIVNELAGNVILNVKNTRVAISADMARKIFV